MAIYRVLFLLDDDAVYFFAEREKEDNFIFCCHCCNFIVSKKDRIHCFDYFIYVVHFVSSKRL